MEDRDSLVVSVRARTSGATPQTSSKKRARTEAVPPSRPEKKVKVDDSALVCRQTTLSDVIEVAQVKVILPNMKKSKIQTALVAHNNDIERTIDYLLAEESSASINQGSEIPPE